MEITSLLLRFSSLNCINSQNAMFLKRILLFALHFTLFFFNVTKCHFYLSAQKGPVHSPL